MNGFLAGAGLPQFAQNQRSGRRHPLDQPIGPFRNPNIAKRHAKPSEDISESFESQSETVWNHFRVSRSPWGEGVRSIVMLQPLTRRYAPTSPYGRGEE